MREFKVGIAVRFIYNNTGVEWFNWQRPLEEWLRKEVVHCISKSFGDKPAFSCDDASDNAQSVRAGIFVRFIDNHLEVIIDKYRVEE